LNLPKYKKNLHIDGNKVISYTTHVATIDRANGKLYRHGHWSMTTSKHINYVASYIGLTIKDQDKDTPRNNKSSELKTVAMVARLGDIFGKTQKQKNDWKARMLKAGLENKGLIMPEDWNELNENDKQARLDGAINAIA